MKKLALLFVILTSCSNIQTTNQKALINTYLEVKGMGFITIQSVSDPVKVNDTTYTATHVFFNKMIEKDVRVLNTYYFTPATDSIKNHNTQKTEIKTDGNWVVSPF